MNRLTCSGFDHRRAMEHALGVLGRPPAFDWIERPRDRGQVVARFVLPVELCPTSNATRRKPDWWHSRLRDEQFRAMLPGFLSSKLPRGKALPGRPQVHAVKFSPRPPDAVSDFGKGPIDRLILPLQIRRKRADGRVVLVDCRRFGLIEDDRPDKAEVRQWWEPSPMAKACVLVLVRVGE